MTNELKTSEEKKSEVKTFENCKNNVILKIKVIPKVAFVYRSILDLECLINFAKAEPRAKIIEGKLTLSYGKINLFDNSVIFLSEVGKISEVLTFDEASKKYEITAEK
jgi:hypothetical protein